MLHYYFHHKANLFFKKIIKLDKSEPFVISLINVPKIIAIKKLIEP